MQVFTLTFPRRNKQKPMATRPAFLSRCLESMLTHGPLLVPEVIDVRAVPGSALTARPFQVMQRRICFTLLDEDDIEPHMACFGPISLVFDRSAVLGLGAMPVIYFPGFRQDADANELGLALLHHLRAVLGLVQDLRVVTQQFETADWGDLIDEPVCREQVGLIERVTASLFDRIGAGAGQLNAMEGAIQSISELVYPADRSGSVQDASFEYFRQREWRVLADLSVSGVRTTQEIGPGIRGRLLEIDGEFFSRKLRFNDEIFVVVDLVQQLCERARSALLGGLRRIICEEAVLGIVEGVLATRPGSTIDVATVGGSKRARSE